MNVLIVLIVFVLVIYFVLASENQCKRTNNCKCIHEDQKYIFGCPSLDYGIFIQSVPDKYMQISCDGTMEEIGWDIFPNYTAGRIESLEINFFPLPNNSFLDFMEKFDIESLKSLSIENVVLRNSSRKTVPKDLFDGLSTLQTLSMSLLDGVILEVDVFENIPHLTELYLENNEIEEIGYMFDNMTHLRVLHLSRNALTEIPDGLFRNLGKLKQLHLLGNNLNSLSKISFSGLRNLTSLELSKNQIHFVDNDAFSELSELVDISLKKNRLGHVSSKLFRQNLKLHTIRIDNNANLTLEDFAFANLKNLSMINLAKTGLGRIPPHVFQGSDNIKRLMLQDNSLQELREDIFRDLKQLRELYLGGNNISLLPDKIFSSLINMETLDLQGNHISEINGDIFKMTKNLKTLILENNKITTISLNHMEYAFGGNPFMNCEMLEELILSRNYINEFPSSIMYMMHLKLLNLTDNQIKNIMVTELKKVSINELKVDLSSNQISRLDFTMSDENADAMNNDGTSTIVFLENNRLACDCQNYNLIRYIRDEMEPAVKTLMNLKLGDSHCASPESMRHMKVKDLFPKHIICPYAKNNCSRDCNCFYRPFDKTVVVDCSNRNLSECPTIEVKLGQVEVNLVGNSIHRGPNSTLGYDNVTNLFLSNNRIEQLKWVPPKIKILHLDGNHLRHLGKDVLEMLKSSNLTLSNNPWACDCPALDLQIFLRTRFDKESKDVVCLEDKKLLIEKPQLCKPTSILVMQITIPILVFFVVASVIIALYVYYEQEIKIWLFAKKLCLWCVTEEELDKDKLYDIFISYSHKDEDLVLQKLLPVLEQGSDPFKICIHVRDWLPGEFITKQVSDSVMNSRRTLVVLSNNFLESVWGKMEFRAAHTQAIEEGMARVIVVKYGDLEEEKLDDELKTYLKTNTYVEWGKPWFWNKLRYALPHSRCADFQKNQKHANMMLKIDDKFELASPPVRHSESTPTVITLEPHLLENHPLKFEQSENVETPPAEAPLIR